MDAMLMNPKRRPAAAPLPVDGDYILQTVKEMLAHPTKGAVQDAFDRFVEECMALRRLPQYPSSLPLAVDHFLDRPKKVTAFFVDKKHGTPKAYVCHKSENPPPPKRLVLDPEATENVGQAPAGS